MERDVYLRCLRAAIPKKTFSTVQQMTLEKLCGDILGDHGSSPIHHLFLKGKMIAEQKTLLAADIDKKYSKTRDIQNKIFSSLQRSHKNPQTPPKTSQSPNICHLK